MAQPAKGQHANCVLAEIQSSTGMQPMMPKFAVCDARNDRSFCT